MAESEHTGRPRHDLEYYLSVPYLLVLETVQRADGHWVRRAEYPELPGCAAEAESAVEAIDLLEDERETIIARLWRLGAEIPAPRPPLSPYWQRLDGRRLGFARWLVDSGKLSEQE